MDLKQIQAEQAEWADRNFGEETMTCVVDDPQGLLYLAGELGTVAHHHLKEEQGIRGTPESHRKEAIAASLGLISGAVGYTEERSEPTDRDCLSYYHVRGLLPLIGVIEEVGELARSHYKEEFWQKSGITKLAEEEAATKDALGDIFIYMLDYARRRGWDFAAIVEETWGQVKQRDWTRNKANGVTA